jgi:hypothetical protein
MVKLFKNKRQRQTHMSTNTCLDLILGTIFIVFGAADRFNTPATNRSSTTAIRYFAALFGYCGVGLAAYALLVHFPSLVTLLLQSPPSDNVVSDEWAQQLSRPLLVALLLTVLLPRLPFLCQCDNWIRKHLQEMAAIPYEVRRLGAELRKVALALPDDLRLAVQQRLERNGFKPADVQFDANATPAGEWTRLTALLLKLEDWESDKKMASFLASFPGQFAELRRQYGQLEPKARNCFRLQDETATSTASARSHDAVLRYTEDFLDQTAELNRAVLDFISRGILHAEFTDGARLQRLRQMGFTLAAQRSTFTFNQIMLVFSLVFLVMLVGVVTFSGIAGGMTFGQTLARLALVSAIYCVAVASAVVPKDKWAMAQRRPGSARPFGFYILAGLLAAVFSQGLNLAFSCVQEHSLAHGWHRLLLTYPWALASFATAMLTAFLIDNPVLPNLGRNRQRLLEGAVQGIATSGVGYLVHDWLGDRLEQVSGASTLAINYHLPALAPVMTMAGAIGFVLGFCIPTWFREAPRGSAKPHFPARLAAAMVATPATAID